MKKIKQILVLAALLFTSTLIFQRCNDDEKVRGEVTPPRAAFQMSYFPFSGTVKDELGLNTPPDINVRNLTFGPDRFGRAASAAEFDGTTSIVEIPNGDRYMKDKSLTLSFWIKSNSTKEGQFVMGLAGWKGFYFDIASDWSSIKLTTNYALPAGKTEAEDLLFAGTGATKDNGGWQGYTFQKQVTGLVGDVYIKDKWVHIVTTYDATSKVSTMYLNGEKVMQTDFNLWPTDSPKTNTTGVIYKGSTGEGGNNLALGFIQGSQNRTLMEDWANPADLYSNHFKGLMDDLRIFRVALTETEVAKLHADEKV
jgi:hypothetical protein